MNALLVKLGDVRIGVLERFQNETQRFTFSSEYCRAGAFRRPILGQIFEDRLPNPITVDGPICWFSHLLPQGVMRNWRCRILNIDTDDTFSLLAHLGADMPGAITLENTEASVLAGELLPAPETGTVDAISRLFKFSLAGAQWKLSARSEGRGLTTKTAGKGTSFIAKFHAPEFPELPQCEFATMNWGKSAGVNMPTFCLEKTESFDNIPEGMPTGDGRVFLIERFDRTPDRKIHMEDFGQILDRPPGIAQFEGSYEEIAAAMKWIAPQSGHEFLRQLVFCIICGNGDAHLKNFSVLYSDGRNGELSPAYDIISTIVYMGSGRETLALNLGGQKQFENVHLSSLSGVVRNLGIEQETGHQLIRDYTSEIVTAWHDPETRDHFSKRQCQIIDKHISMLPLTRIKP